MTKPVIKVERPADKEFIELLGIFGRFKLDITTMSKDSGMPISTVFVKWQQLKRNYPVKIDLKIKDITIRSFRAN